MKRPRAHVTVRMICHWNYDHGIKIRTVSIGWKETRTNLCDYLEATISRTAVVLSSGRRNIEPQPEGGAET